jgi:hypothetical protein
VAVVALGVDVDDLKTLAALEAQVATGLTALEVCVCVCVYVSVCVAAGLTALEVCVCVCVSM